MIAVEVGNIETLRYMTYRLSNESHGMSNNGFNSFLHNKLFRINTKINDRS